jgi:hypothetical protein
MTDGGSVDDAETLESPFITIWESPRATIRRIVDADSRLHVTTLFFAQGFVGAIESALEHVGAAEETLVATAVRMVVTLVVVVPMSYLSAWYLRWIATWFGGQASRQEVAASVAWSTVPSIVGTAATIATRLALFGLAGFKDEVSAALAGGSLLSTTLSLAPILFAIWSGYLSILCLAEVNRFSMARAVGTHLTALLIALILVAGAALAAFVLVGSSFS